MTQASTNPNLFHDSFLVIVDNGRDGTSELHPSRLLCYIFYCSSSSFFLYKNIVFNRMKMNLSTCRIANSLKLLLSYGKIKYDIIFVPIFCITFLTYEPSKTLLIIAISFCENVIDKW